LTALRAQIDAIDDALIELIGRRAGLAADLAKVKAPGGSVVRPAREAQLLRRLIAKAPDGVDRDLVMEVWRALIAANIRRQNPIEAAVWAAPDMIRAFDLARRHFGASMRLQRVDDARAALTKAAESPTTLAVLPWPGATGPGGWWPILNEGRFRGLSVISGLPLLADNGHDPEVAVVVSEAALEEAGGDVTLGVAYDPHYRAARALSVAGLTGQEVARAREAVLIRIQGFLPPGDLRVAQMITAGLDGFRVVGSFARI
jgi:chorismate mutase